MHIKFSDILKSIGVFLLVFPAACQKSSDPFKDNTVISFEKTPVPISLSTEIIEASGIADSRNNPGNLWVEEDSGNPPQLYLLGHDGSIKKTVMIDGAVNRDWEDIAVANGPEPGKNYLYVGDIGDNDNIYPECTIYRFIEPLADVPTVTSYDRIVFQYADGPRDAEAFLVDGVTKDIYIITKRDTKSRIYKIAYPQNTSDTNQAVFVSELSYSGVVSASLSVNEKELIIKTYTALNYYTRKEGESLEQTFKTQATLLGYQLEPQGEAVSFALDNSGFYTLSEKAFDISPVLYFYKRK